MGLFVVKEENEKRIHVYQREFISLKTVGIYIVILFLLPFIGRFVLTNAALLLSLFTLYFLTIILGCWFAFEKAYYSTLFPRKYMREGKRVRFEKRGVTITK